MSAMTDLIEEYQAKADQAANRIWLFETGRMETWDIGPPRRETTPISIEAERALIANYAAGIELARSLARARGEALHG